MYRTVNDAHFQLLHLTKVDNNAGPVLVWVHF